MSICANSQAKLRGWPFKIIQLSLALLLVTSTALIANQHVPNNMDELSLYHTLACHYYPYNALNQFRASCTGYDLKLPFTDTYLPIREFGYMGSILSLFILTFFILFPNPVITRIVGLGYLIIESHLFGKLSNRSWLTIFIGLYIFFPYFFQHYVDTGATNLQITLYLLVILFLKRWSLKQQIRHLLFAALIAFLGIYTKLTFIWLIPGIIVYLLSKIKSIKKIPYQQLSIALLLFSILIASLFFSLDRSGNPYFQEFFIDNQTTVDKNLFDSSILRALINPYESTQLIFLVLPLSSITIAYSTFIFLFCPFIWILAYLRNKTYLSNSVLWYKIFALTVMVILVTGKAWSIHHIILAYPALIISFLHLIPYLKKIISKLAWTLLVTGFVLSNLYLFFTFSHQRIRNGNELIKNKINKMLTDQNLAQEYIYVVVDWGMYYFQSLFGNKHQSVIYIEPFSSMQDVEKLRSISNRLGRKILFIYNQNENETDPQFIRHNFKVKDCQKFSQSDSWKILIEPGTASLLCDQ